MIGSLVRIAPGSIVALIACAAGERRTIVLHINNIPVQEKDIFLENDVDTLGFFELSFRLETNSACLVSISDKYSGEKIPPGDFLYAPAESDFAIPKDISSLSAIVKAVIENSPSHSSLQRDVSTLLSWAGFAVDRSSILRRDQETAASELRATIERAGGLGETLGRLLQQIQSNFTPIVVPRHREPMVSVVIPVFNNFELTYNCIASMVRHLPTNYFEVVIVDDASTDETLLATTVFFGGVKIIRNQENAGFIASCNIGASVGSSKFIYFLNNDTIVEGQWLDALIETFTDCDDAGIVGSRLLSADGSLQECGGVVWKDGSAWNLGRDAKPDRSEYRSLRKTDYVSGAALMISRDLFNHLGGFDPLYTPAYYEDTDLCFKVRRAGRSVYVQPASTIIHLEGKSNGIDVLGGIKQNQIKNQHKFAKNWQLTLSHHDENGSNIQSAIYRYYKAHALFVDDTVLTPDKDAGSNAALQHIRSLMRLGYHVTFIPADNMAEIQPYSNNLERIGVEFISSPQFLSVEDYLINSDRAFELFYVHRFGNAEKYMDMFHRYMPNASVVYNVADLHSLREHREARVFATDNKSSLEALSNRELDFIAKADAAITHSSFEQDYALELRPNARIVTVPWTVQAVEEVAPFDSREGVGFIGGFAHKPNVDAVVWFLETALPGISHLGIKFFFAGSQMPDFFQKFVGPNIVMLGHVPNERAFMAARRLSIAPLRYGAGLKGKVLTSFAEGTPCVMTSVAAEGFELTPRLRSFVSDDPGQFAQHIAELHNHERLWTEACWDSVEVVDAGFSREKVDAQMRAALHLAEAGVAARTGASNGHGPQARRLGIT